MTEFPNLNRHHGRALIKNLLKAVGINIIREIDSFFKVGLNFINKLDGGIQIERRKIT